MEESTGTLRSHLNYEPRELNFGTSGRRGELVHLSQLEIYINALAELRYLQSLATEDGGIREGEEFYFAYDLRPSSTRLVDNGRGEICQAIESAIRDAGMRPVNLGPIPTPALTYFALSRQKGSIMVTGSHIPFDRNGYKLNTSRGELLKFHEQPINAAAELTRAEVYNQPFEISLFDETGMFNAGHVELSRERSDARELYLQRYLDFFSGLSLNGMRVVVYQHSAVGRDLLVELLQRLGAQVTPAGRSETFVPLDTENIDTAQLAVIQALAGDAEAVVSTDGDSDRPLILGVENGRVKFFPGDLAGMVVAEYLGADAVVVPVTCNDGIDRGSLAPVLEPKTRIGSPWVIAGMDAACAKGRKAICGWEANGGFLTGSDFVRNGHVLKQLATRDAFLPILSVLFAAREQGVSVSELFRRLPARFSRAGLLKNFPRAVSLEIVKQTEFEQFFPADKGFGTIRSIDHSDGVRIQFDNGDVAHIRPSGNADELRIYAVAGTEERASEIVAMGIDDQDGILRQMERAVAH